MTAITLKQETESYWNLIKDAGNEVKLALIKSICWLRDKFDVRERINAVGFDN